MPAKFMASIGSTTVRVSLPFTMPPVNFGATSVVLFDARYEMGIYDESLQLTIERHINEIRDLIFDDATPEMQRNMMEYPADTLEFAVLWIQRARGLNPDTNRHFRRERWPK